ncbi:MAG: EAL domain-containing protein [Rhodoferax sp.]|uniref:bifunctional diguanylate cyclase/phosphodiesterase n=1 Tax=Rhodoferax sp. TaxID=50421 RepID=UPI00301615F6
MTKAITSVEPTMAFEDESNTGVVATSRTSWRVLLVDDDPDVHLATVFAVGSHHFGGRPVEFLHAYSALQARDIVAAEDNLAFILLDVVMESDTAGLDLIEYIRHSVGLTKTRIVLRTGQPGYAPELDTILKYDINDYKSKSELNQVKLLTLFITTLRAYQQLCSVEANRQGLSLIVKASGSFMQMQGLGDFAAGVITQLAALLGTNAEGVVCAQTERLSAKYSVLAAAGQYAELIDQPLELLSNTSIRQRLVHAFERCSSDFGVQDMVLYFGHRNGLDMAVYIDTGYSPGPVEAELLNVFCANLSACLHNQSLIEQLREQAFVDELLGLPNRTRFIAEIEVRQTEGVRDWALALVDIDDFSSVNELMGHSYGDKLLKALAARLKVVAGREVMLARVSGNAFGLLGHKIIINPDHLQCAIQEPLIIDDRPHKVSVTSGFVHIGTELQAGSNWLKNATIALKQAKRLARGQHVFYTSDIGSEARSRALLLADLHIAFDQDHLFMVYQPQIDLVSGKLIGLEALMRWRREDGQLVSPDRFIPVAEQSGLIVSMGHWALQIACTKMKELMALGLAPARMAVNVSVEQFKSLSFVESVRSALQISGLDGSRLELEITESVSVLGLAHIKEQLCLLRNLRIAIAIDDFGTGYSSLSYLEQLPLDRMKIDKAFVRQLGRSGAPRIAEVIVELGEALGLRVLAEGIEDRATWDALQAMGCHEGQGFFISKPLEGSMLLAWIQDYAASNSSEQIVLEPSFTLA